MEAILSPRGDSVGQKIRPNWLRPLCLWYLGSLQTTKWAKFFSFCKGREEGSQNNSCVASHVLLFSLDGANPCHSIQRRPCLSFGLRDFFCFKLQTNCHPLNQIWLQEVTPQVTPYMMTASYSRLQNLNGEMIGGLPVYPCLNSTCGLFLLGFSLFFIRP